MSIARTAPGHRALCSLALALSLLPAGCASAGRLAEYDFPGATLAVVTTAPPHPDVLTDDEWDIEGSSLLDAVVSVGTRIAREASAEKARARLDSATAAVDVAGRMADRVLEGANRVLRTRPTTLSAEPDFELEVRVGDYGIEADDLDAEAAFRVRAVAILREAATGVEVWKGDVDEEEPIRHSDWGNRPGGAVNNVATAAALRGLSVPEMEEALRSLADFAADRIVEKLREGHEKAMG
jgi:hypothetical protein